VLHHEKIREPLWHGVRSQPPMDECRKLARRSAWKKPQFQKLFIVFRSCSTRRRETRLFFFLPFRFYSTRRIRPIHRIHQRRATCVAEPSIQGMRVSGCGFISLFVLFSIFCAGASFCAFLETPSYSSQSRLLVTQVRVGRPGRDGRKDQAGADTASVSLETKRRAPFHRRQAHKHTET